MCSCRAPPCHPKRWAEEQHQAVQLGCLHPQPSTQAGASQDPSAAPNNGRCWAEGSRAAAAGGATREHQLMLSPFPAHVAPTPAPIQPVLASLDHPASAPSHSHHREGPAEGPRAPSTPGPRGTGLCPALREQPREGDRGWLTCVTASVPWVPREGQQQHVPVFSSTHPCSAANTACLPGAAGKQPLHLLQRKLQELGSLPVPSPSFRRGKSLCRAATFSHPCWETLIPVQPPSLCHLGTAAPASSCSSPCPSPVPTERGDERAGCEELPQVQLSSDATSLGLGGEIHNVNMGSDNTAPAGSHTPLHPPCNYHGFNLALFIVLPWSFPFNEQSRSFLPIIITQLPILEVFCNGISGHKFYPPF